MQNLGASNILDIFIGILLGQLERHIPDEGPPIFIPLIRLSETQSHKYCGTGWKKLNYRHPYCVSQNLILLQVPRL